MGRPSVIRVGGLAYSVLDTLGFQPSIGLYAKEVMCEGKPRMAVSEGARGPWRWHVVRIEPRGPIVGQ